MARIHCRFLAVNITGPWWAEVGKDAVWRGVPENISNKINFGLKVIKGQTISKANYAVLNSPKK